MEWWSVFSKVRKAIFIFIALISLIWSGVLIFYLVREWIHFSILQRSIVIAMVSVNIVTMVVQYLMIVLPFRVRRDFFRTLFLTTIHSATAVLYTLFGPNFSCKIFPSKVVCEDVDLAFLICSWVITGLLVGYTVYLCIMTRIPRPLPQITPNFLIDPDVTRRSSVSSVNSATRLIQREKEASPRSVPTIVPQISVPQNRTVPKKLFVTNGMASPVSPPTATPAAGAPLLRVGGSYGAMGAPRSFNASPAPTFSTQSTMMTERSPMVPAATWNNGFSQRRGVQPDTLQVQLPNPFMDPISRPGTTDTAYTSYTATSAPFGMRGAPFVGQDMVFLSPFQLPYESEKTPAQPSSPGAESIYSLYSTDSPKDEKDIDLERGTTAAPPFLPQISHNMRLTLSSPPRMHTATPHSVRSMAPSVEWPSEQARAQTPVAMSRVPPPAPVHARAASDPVYRPYTASEQLPTIYAAPDYTVPLPNPFPMVGATSVRRYSSIGHTRAQMSYPGPSSAASVKNVHLQAAMGRAPPRTQTYPVVGAGVGLAGKKVVSRAEWQRLVVAAASASTSGRP
ncbi:hypothetical protein BXZ70DRAFT_244723 [Cristinia sonorae]|uniref:Uncharacterized protein n=1 Tax=Cristinia sonorae TaxID=1940300 RepID=A0A8K0UWU9_9AGAR|nr:hypothetical protein BXZ70DRAFT_244723 [Cristinia sonorae]